MAKILIVDDEPRIRELIREHLEHEGFQCEEATDGSAALAALAACGSWELLLTACALAGLLARSQIFIAMRFPGARPGGMGEAFKQGTRPVHDLIAAAVTLAACALAGWHGLYALLTALAGSTALLLYARRRLGGVTGDVFGCTVECTEWLVLLTFCTL